LETALYYTFSTISQTLAGAIALLGAFVLYRLQSIAAEIEDSSLKTVNSYQSPLRDEVIRLHAAGKFEGVLEFTRTHGFNDPSAHNAYVVSQRERLVHLLPLKKSIHLRLNVSLVLTVGLIAVSVGVLAVTPRVTNISGLPQIVLAAGCMWLMACLIAYASLIRKTLA